MSTSNFYVNCTILVVCLSLIFDSPVTLSAPVLDKYEEFNGRCYKLHSKAERWNDARKICIFEGGHMAVAKSSKQAAALVTRFHDPGQAFDAMCQDAVWVGIHDAFNEGDWTTIFDEPITAVFNEWSNKWGTRQPDNLGGHQNCGSLYRDGKLNDVPCEIKLPFICIRDVCPSEKPNQAD